MAAVVRKRIAKGPEAAAIRICREIDRRNAGRILRWHEADALEKRLGLSDKAAQAAFDFAVSKHWIAAVGDPVFSVTLLDAGRAMIAGMAQTPTKAKARN